MQCLHLMVVVLTCFLSISDLAVAIEEGWEDGYFDPSAGVVIVEIVEKTIKLKMDENVDMGFKIGKFLYTGNDGEEMTLQANDYKMFTLTNENKEWIFRANGVFDYDNDNDRVFRCKVTQKQNVFTLEITLNNLNDNPFYLLGGSCPFPENKMGPTECIYTVTDKDGIDPSIAFTYSTDQFEILDITEFYKKKEAILKLHFLEEQDFETVNSLAFIWSAKDDADYEQDHTIIVNILDEPDEPPKWQTQIGSKSIPEEKADTFTVLAIDGDINVTSPILYTINDDCDNCEKISIDERSGVVSIGEIDRDAEDLNTITFTITATEEKPPHEETKQDIVLLIQDINDNPPTIVIDEVKPDFNIIEENFNSALGCTITMNDVDVGVNATYDVILSSNLTNPAIGTFMQITPSRGYRETSFSISVTNSKQLDYDEYEDMQSPFVVTITATDPDHPATQDITITLLNINDEMPEFQSNEYKAEIPETFGRQEVETLPIVDAAQFFAIDKDVGDSVSYEIVGASTNRILKLKTKTPANKEPLVIETIRQSEQFQLFDFENQEEMLVSIKATDNFPGSTIHYSAIAQLTITITDVNDESPTISANQQATTIEENVDNPDAVDIVLEAHDADLTNDLEFSIDWDWGSSYAMKNGRKIIENDFQKYTKCFTIVKTKVDVHNANGKLKLDIDKSPDFELFDTLYLSVKVVDKNQKVNNNEAKLTIIINIENDNDNEPVFDLATLVGKTIKEHSDKDTVIGIIKADDKDFDYITYGITYTDGSETDLVYINDKGEIYVKADKAIEADPDIPSLEFTVTASDGKWHDTEDLIIKIIDTNENHPLFVIPPEGYKVHENTRTHEWDLIQVNDIDRDDDYKDFTCSLLGQGADKYFVVTTMPNKGCQLSVKIEDDDDEIDREATANYRLKLTVKDDPNGNEHNEESSDVEITILDVNDNKPIVDAGVKLKVSESDQAGKVIGRIPATDKDEVGSDNSVITFMLMDVIKVSTPEESSVDAIELGVNHFELDLDSGELRVKEDLKSFYGDYTLIIKTEDKGVPPLSTDDNEVALEIEKFNYESVKFDAYPGTLTLREEQEVGRPLVKWDQSQVEDIVANDQQSVPPNNKYAIDFRIVETTPKEIFTLYTISDTHVSLRLTEYPNPEVAVYIVKLSANSKDSFPARPEDTLTVKVRFFDSDANPTFDENEINSHFFDEMELAVLDDLPEAKYLEEIDVTIEYTITEAVPMGAYEIVDDDSQELIVRVVEELNLAKMETDPFFVVLASRGRSSAITASSTLRVNVKLNDINNNPPKFDTDIEERALFIGNEGATSIMKVKAIDPDEHDEIIYSIDRTSYEAVGEGLPTEPTDAQPLFEVSENGDLDVRFRVLASMTGRIEFDILAEDGDPTHTASLHIKLTVISEVHLSSILFENPPEKVKENEKFVQTTLAENFNYMVGIRSIQPATASQSALYEEESVNTEVIAYFINDKESVGIDKDEIRNQLNNLAFYAKLRRAFGTKSLLLLNIVSEVGDESMEETYKIALIAVSAISGLLLIVLIGFFTYKFRSQSNRLKRLDNAEARRPTSVQMHNLPTANRRATAYNPRFNLDQTEDSIIDDLSFTNSPRVSKKAFVDDDDEDFIGIENNDIFKIDATKF